MGIGIKIKQLREERLLSQAELAALLDIEQGTLSKIESEKTEKLDLLMMDRVCKIFDKEFSYFLPKDRNNIHIETNHGVVINHGTVNNFPEELMRLIKEIIANHEEQTQKIKALEKKLKTSS